MLVVVLSVLFLRAQPIDLSITQAYASHLLEWRQSNALLLVVLYALGYIFVTALSLPLATWMTLAAGALFGFWQGFLLVSFASSIGATLAFLAARYLLSDWVRGWLGTRFRAIDEGFDKDGAFYLFTLRLIPVLPFFAINLLMGLTSMRTGTFFVVSQVGMLAGTAVYVNAGTQLAALDSLSGIVSVPLVVSFTFLGLSPGARACSSISSIVKKSILVISAPQHLTATLS